MLAQFGLTSANTALVTISVPGIDYAMTRYNGLVIRPEKGKDVRRENYFLRDVTLVVRDLELST
jgi:hypothetical protein